jgi:hypothetical protein
MRSARRSLRRSGGLSMAVMTAWSGEQAGRQSVGRPPGGDYTCARTVRALQTSPEKHFRDVCDFKGRTGQPKTASTETVCSGKSRAAADRASEASGVHLSHLVTTLLVEMSGMCSNKVR